MKQTILPRQNLSAFHLDQSVLFQFILSEFIVANTEVETISHLTPSVLEGEVDGLEPPLHQLFGSSPEYVSLLSWNFKEGILSRLKKYVLCFSQFHITPEKDQRLLYQYTCQALELCQKCINELQAYVEGIGEENVEVTLHKNLVKLQKQVGRFGQMVIKLTYYFHFDENVIFFILRHKQQFDNIFGQDFTKRFFNKMYEGGPSEAEKLMTTRYTERGFQHLLPTIQTKISEL